MTLRDCAAQQGLAPDCLRPTLVPRCDYTVLWAAKEIGKTPTEVALAWVLGRLQVTSVLVGATREEQLELNLGALVLQLPHEIECVLTEVS